MYRGKMSCVLLPGICHIFVAKGHVRHGGRSYSKNSFHQLSLVDLLLCFFTELRSLLPSPLSLMVFCFCFGFDLVCFFPCLIVCFHSLISSSSSFSSSFLHLLFFVFFFIFFLSLLKSTKLHLF